MRILWFTNIPSSGSIGHGETTYRGGWISSLENELVKRKDIELNISYYSNTEIHDFKVGDCSHFPIYKRHANSKFKRLLNRFNGFKKNDKTEIRQVLKIIDKVKPDLIHVHGTEDNFGLILKHTGIPVAISIQGLLGPISGKFFSGLSIAVTNEHEGIKSEILLKSSRMLFNNMKLRSIREKEILLHAKYILGRTDWDYNVSRILAPDSTYFVGNEMLRNSFYHGEWHKEKLSEAIHIVTVVSPALYKGVETIIKTADLLLSCKDFKFEWSVVGIDANGEIVRMVQKWAELKFKKVNVAFLGKKSETEVLQILLAADVFCQVSHIENSSNSLCEAMLIGMPIVATFVGGTGSLIETNKEGILVQEGEPYALAGAIVKFANNWDLAIEYGRNARLTALKRHNKKTIVDDLVSNYARMMS